MNDVELIARALLQVGKARFLFSGSAMYEELIRLEEPTTKYESLLITFSYAGLRQTVVSGNVTQEIHVCMPYISANVSSKSVEFIRGRLDRLGDNTYTIGFVKNIKENGVYSNNDVNDFRVISIVGIS